MVRQVAEVAQATITRCVTFDAVRSRLAWFLRHGHPARADAVGHAQVGLAEKRFELVLPPQLAAIAGAVLKLVAEERLPDGSPILRTGAEPGLQL